jgi:flagellar basal-body rod protein FlgC
VGLFSSINTAATGLTAQRLRLDVVSNNIANADTTRDVDGTPFRRSRVIFRPRVSQPYWKSPFLPKSLDHGVGEGVRVVEIEEDLETDPRMVYDPTHPDAIKTGKWAGYVEYPNVNIVEEMVDMISASRSYEANLAVVEGSKSMFMSALSIGRR